MFKIRLDNYGFILTIAELFFLSLKTAEPNLRFWAGAKK